jgi:hypothetical protein
MNQWVSQADSVVIAGGEGWNLELLPSWEFMGLNEKPWVMPGVGWVFLSGWKNPKDRRAKVILC